MPPRPWYADLQDQEQTNEAQPMIPEHIAELCHQAGYNSQVKYDALVIWQGPRVLPLDELAQMSEQEFVDWLTGKEVA